MLFSYYINDFAKKKAMIKTEVLVKKVREDIVKFGFNSGSSAHYGGALSMADFLTTLYMNLLINLKT